MRRLLHVVLALAACARAAPLDPDADRLPGWLGEQERNAQVATPDRWIEPIAWEPRAFLYHGFMTPEECEHIKNVARPRMERSMVVDPDTGGEKLDDIRTSFGTFLARGETDVIRQIELRVAEWAQVPEENAEQLQILRYGIGQQYNDHWDWFDAKTLQVDAQGNTQRVATVLMFLSEVEEGGETVFPLKSKWADPEAQKAASNFSQCAKRGPAIKPRTGDAILFWDMKLTGEDDESSMHASCPVIKGEKWTATKWMHTSKFKGLQEGIPNTCDDKQPEDCQKWAEHGECTKNAAFMMGVHGVDGNCIASCCVPSRKAGVTEDACSVCASSRRSALR